MGFLVDTPSTEDKLLCSGRIEFMDVSDEGVILDMDTMRDYRAIQQKIASVAYGKN